MSQFNSITKKENPDKTAKDKNHTWINPINNCLKKSFFLRHFLCFFVFILLIIYLYLSYKKDIRTYFFLSNLKIILPALVAGAGVFEGLNINRKKSFKEIVTKERINWLHRLQNNLSEYLKLTREGKARDEDKVTKLYYKIIFAINHEEDKKALDAIKNYNDYIFGKELEKNIKIKKKIIELESQDTHEVKKFTYYKYKKNFGKLRSKVEKSFAKIFKEVWEEIKKEAD